MRIEFDLVPMGLAALIALAVGKWGLHWRTMPVDGRRVGLAAGIAFVLYCGLIKP